MIKGFPITFVQVALEQTLQKIHNDNPNLVGGKNQIEIHSFYEQLKGQDEVDRFVKTFRDLTEQQNRSGLIANGILMSPENPTITNLYSSMIIPMTWACSLRVKLSDRDLMLETINALIDELKGSKVDIAELKCRDEQGRAIYVPFAVGTIGHNPNAPVVKCGDYIGEFDTDTPTKLQISNKIYAYKTNYGIENGLANNDYFYFKGVNELKAGYFEFYNVHFENEAVDEVEYTEQTPTKTRINGVVSLQSIETYDEVPPITTIFIKFDVNGVEYSDITNIQTITLGADGKLNVETSFEILVDTAETMEVTIKSVANSVYSDYHVVTTNAEYTDIIFPPEHESFEKYKLSLSFEGLRCDTPRTLNGNEYCEISFGGSATLVNESVKLGNDLIKISMQKNKILAQTPITFSNDTVHYLEPLELPSGNGANTIPNQLTSNVFKVNTHTDSLTATLQYTFILDEQQALLKQLFKYGRYGTVIPNTSGISPNMIFNVDEWWSAWGVVDKETYLGKLIESIDIENTESDTLTLSITMQVQGANN